MVAAVVGGVVTATLGVGEAWVVTVVAVIVGLVAAAAIIIGVVEVVVGTVV